MSRAREHSKTQAIRDALVKAGRLLTLRERHPLIERRLKQIVGRQKLYTLLSVMQTGGELLSMGRGEQRYYMLKPKGGTR